MTPRPNSRTTGHLDRVGKRGANHGAWERNMGGGGLASETFGKSLTRA
jgi:hypothetical protein